MLGCLGVCVFACLWTIVKPVHSQVERVSNSVRIEGGRQVLLQSRQVVVIAGALAGQGEVFRAIGRPVFFITTARLSKSKQEVLTR